MYAESVRAFLGQHGHRLSCSIFIYPTQVSGGWLTNLVALDLVCQSESDDLGHIAALNTNQFPHLQCLIFRQKFRKVEELSQDVGYLAWVLGQSWPRVTQWVLGDWFLSLRDSSRIAQNLPSLHRLFFHECIHMGPVCPLITSSSANLKETNLEFPESELYSQVIEMEFSSKLVTACPLSPDASPSDLNSLRMRFPNIHYLHTSTI
ncbi:hypothetical protein BJ085DRAFT_29775 [Dimargaris cristalligena]|uniref:F-box domain-containing protein n=1 Tax=Dimargaris cristalligena TaxID=215637 RepID=A0A4P9ZWT0_9FUNG|nr:hypothetical protein BJ085DRAFT_29775 [Dimargaris cristalligena]|eukprot:RKP38083.1 hypothetical protein BJ085DRAFT_29775 [Dimargaris cristalligena]